MVNKIITIECDKYKDRGLYIDSDGILFTLTDKIIQEAVDSYSTGYSQIPLSIKENEKFQRCPGCTGEDDLCDALKAISPLSKYIDKFQSFDSAIAIYKGEDKDLYSVNDTTLQVALQYSVIHSLTKYCKYGMQYAGYFEGILPMLPPQEIAEFLYLNAYFMHEGNKEEIKDFIQNICGGFTEKTKRLLDRLVLVCENDVFLNGFANFHTAMQFLSFSSIEDKLRKKRQLDKSLISTFD